VDSQADSVAFPDANGGDHGGLDSGPLDFVALAFSSS
jgi:hypothetical protein